jgi:hypothetical protein
MENDVRRPPRKQLLDGAAVAEIDVGGGDFCSARLGERHGVATDETRRTGYEDVRHDGQRAMRAPTMGCDDSWLWPAMPVISARGAVRPPS